MSTKETPLAGDTFDPLPTPQNDIKTRKRPEELRLQADEASSESSRQSDVGRDTEGHGDLGGKSKFKPTLPRGFAWIPANFDWPHLKPVIRSAIAGWISVIFIIVARTEALLGQASFLVVIVSFLSPPRDPFIATLERELIIVFFVTLAWAWSCLGIKLASIARKQYVPNASLTAIFDGQYIEAVPTIIMAVFLFLGSSFFLYIKARQGPGPFIFATVLACVTLDISLNVAPLFPYPYYIIGESVVLPVAIHAAIALICSVLIFPETINAQMTKRLRLVFLPLAEALELQRTMLALGPIAGDLHVDEFRVLVAQSEAALAPLAASAQMMNRDISWGRFSAPQLAPLHDAARKLPARAHGMVFYFDLLDPTRERFPGTAVPSRRESRAGTPLSGTPAVSRPPTPSEENVVQSITPPAPQSGRDSPIQPSIASLLVGHKSGHPHRRRHHHHAHFQFHTRSFTEMFHPPERNAVGIFESQKYLNLETRFTHPDGEALIQRAVTLLSESASDLLECSAGGLRYAVAWLEKANRDRFEVMWAHLPGIAKGLRKKDDIIACRDAKARLEDALDKFRKKSRLIVLEPYNFAFDGEYAGNVEPPPHRYLFQSFVYQYHLMQFATVLSAMLSEIDDLESKGDTARLWVPTIPLRSVLSWDKWAPHENMDRCEDDDPDVIPGIDPSHRDDLGVAGRRDPDASPPTNAFEVVGTLIYEFFSGLGGGNAIFALKAGVLTVILSIPSFFKGSAFFAYKNKFVWGLFMGQLTLARFRGDTTFGLSARIFSTFFGGLVGLVMWYVASGRGPGNAYGLAAVCAFCFPFFFFGLLYLPWPPMTSIIFFVTAALVVGYSWQDTHLPILSSPGVGFAVEWRRFVLVTAGVVAAFLFSFLPPSTTLRAYQRRTYATTVSELGTIYCAIVSFAHSRQDEESERITRSVNAVRVKLKRSAVLSTNVIYEFSLRGKWPADRYNKILKIQLEIANLLGHLRSVIEQLEPAWGHAFLRRTRLTDPDFQGSVLAVISLISTSLRTGTPLPQITPCPLLDRFMLSNSGFNIQHPDTEKDYGLPRILNLDTLQNEQYLIFSVGVSTAFGLISRLDMLMMGTKELVGEQYHLQGIELPILS